MTTIDQAMASKATGNYTTPIRVKVVARGDITKYKGPDGSDRQTLSVAVSDGFTVIKLQAYDPKVFPKLVVSNSVVVREMIRKTVENVRCWVATQKTKIFIGQEMTVPDHHHKEGEALVNPPPAEVVLMEKALASPQKHKVSIRGKIVQEEAIRTVPVKGEDVQIKSITIQDRSGSAKVTLWRDMSQTSLKTEDFVTLTDLVTNTWNNVTTLSTTARSKIEKTEAPEESSTITIVGVALEEGTAQLLLADDEMMSVDAELLVEAMKVKDEDVEDIEMMTSKGPVTAQIKTKGDEVLEISLI